MDGMQRGNACFALLRLGASAPTAVELALLSFAVFQRWTSALETGSRAPCCATEAPYCATGQCQKFLDFFNAANR
jgi:hypothetical protein